MKWYESRFAANVGEGILFFLICFGIGTCSMLSYNVRIVVEGNPKVEQVEEQPK